MGIIASLVISGVILMLINFIYDSVKDTDTIVKEGGMRVKYRTLVSHYLELNENMKIIKETNKYICIGMSNNYAKVVFHLQHTFDKINISFEFNNISQGEHSLSWTFSNNMSQYEMIDIIDDRILQYLENVNAKFM